MRIWCEVNLQESLRRGIDARAGGVVLSVDPASLSEEDRALIAELAGEPPGEREGGEADLWLTRPTVASGWRPTLGSPTSDGLAEALAAERAARAERVAREAQERSGKADRIEREIQQILGAGPAALLYDAGDPLREDLGDDGVASWRPLRARLPWELRDIQDSRLAALVEAAMPLADQASAAARERRIAERRAQAARERSEQVARAELDRQRGETVRTLIESHGDPSQRARLAEGLLPDGEPTALLRELALGPIQLERYVPVTSSDLAEECQERGHEVRCQICEPEEMAAEPYAALVAVRAAVETVRDRLPGAEVVVTARLHACDCDARGCDASDVERLGALVTVRWRGLEASREYAL